MSQKLLHRGYNPQKQNDIDRIEHKIDSLYTGDGSNLCFGEGKCFYFNSDQGGLLGLEGRCSVGENDVSVVGTVSNCVSPERAG